MYSHEACKTLNGLGNSAPCQSTVDVCLSVWPLTHKTVLDGFILMKNGQLTHHHHMSINTGASLSVIEQTDDGIEVFTHSLRGSV